AGHGFKYLYLDQPDWVKSIWSAGYFPLRPPFFYPSPQGYLVVYPPLFQLATAFFYTHFGFAGLYILPALCTLILLGWTVLLLRRCGITPINIALGVFILVFCSPLMLYGVMFWEHLPAVLLLFGGLSVIVAPPARSWVSAVLGFLCGLSIWLRPEAGMMILLYGIAVAILYFRERRTIYIAFGMGVGLAMLPWVVFNFSQYGSLFGIHGRQLLQDNSPESRIGWLNGWRNLTSINRISVRYFWFVLILFPVIVHAVRHKNSEIRPLLLASIVILYSVLTPFMLPNDGITQWGPRYFLAIIPVTLVALLVAPNARRLLPLIAVAALPSFYQNTHGGGYKELPWRYNHRLTGIYQLLDRKPGCAVIASPHFLSYDFGYLFDRVYFFGASGNDSVRRLLPLLAAHGVHEVICLYNPRFNTLPPMLQDSATLARYRTESARGWIKEDIAFKIIPVDSVLSSSADLTTPDHKQ
ncbi:MAG TPA: hypothetical protein VMH27_03665, partial [Puia sp.]|nr:hypothetical protein [Puia sp.]